jgi:hypothetical protein
MVRRIAKDSYGSRTLARRHRAPRRAQKIDCRDAALKVNQLKTSSKVQRVDSADPGPAGFDWVEIDFKHPR